MSSKGNYTPDYDLSILNKLPKKVTDKCLVCGQTYTRIYKENGILTYHKCINDDKK